MSLPRVYLAWPTVDDEHPDSPTLDLLAHVLTDGDASRLERALVREGRVAKDVSADSDTKEIGGLFTIQATAAEGKTPKEIEAALAKELDRLKAEPVTQTELTRALAKFEKRTYNGLTSPQSRAFLLAIGFAEKDDPAYYRKDIARYFTVTPADVARVAAKYLAADKVVLEVVPMKPGGAKAKAVQAGPTASEAAEPDVAERTPAKGPDWSKMPGASEAGEFKPPAIVRKTLKNGVDVRVVPWRTLPIVTARWLVPHGTADDPEGKAGLAELTATLLTKGTKDKTANELAEALESLGVGYSCSADLNDTTLAFNVLSRNLEPALALLAPIYTAPRLDPSDFDRERDLQLADLLQGPDQVGWRSPSWSIPRQPPALRHGPSLRPAERRLREDGQGDHPRRRQGLPRDPVRRRSVDPDRGGRRRSRSPRRHARTGRRLVEGDRSPPAGLRRSEG